MSDLSLPVEGLTILHEHLLEKTSTNQDLSHIIQLDIVENTTKEILRSIRNNEQVRLRLGKKSSMQYGKKSLSLDHVPTTYPSEVMAGPLDGSKPMYFSGRLSHILEDQKAKQDTVKTDEALAALQNTLKSMKEQQASLSTTLVRNKGDLQKQESKPTSFNTKDRLLGTASPSSPYLGAGLSPRIGPTSNPLSTSAPTREKIRQDAMRIPIVHLLAMGPMTSQAVADKLNVSHAECEKVLDKVARDANGGTKDLKEKSFRELDVWKFPYQTEEDRKAAIERAIHAYDRMRIGEKDSLWQLLLPKEDRGKGTVLSRLNFDRPPPAAATPKPNLDGDNKAEASDREVKSKKAKSGPETKEGVHRKKLSGDTSSKKTEKAPAKASAHATKQDTKFKSSERIEDSDEEVEGVEVVPAKPKVSKVKEREPKMTQVGKMPSAARVTEPQQHNKSKPTTSTSVNGEAADKRRLQTDKSKLKPQSKNDSTLSASRISPRPRTGSSPQKPSPLGSSPPTNSTDLENSSKSSTQSSAPSSPPSSTDMPLSQARKNYSPVIANKNRDAANPNKRKAEKNDAPPAKRQQIHGLGLPKGLTDHLQQRTPERRHSGSSLSSPDKMHMTKESVIAAGREFKMHYAKYKDLHIKLSHLDPDERTEKDIDKLWRMHERLDEMKSDLWADWAKVTG